MKHIKIKLIILTSLFIGYTSNVFSQNWDIEKKLKELNITLPEIPTPAGSYALYKTAGKLIYISQIAWENNQIEKKGQVGKELTEEQVKEASYITMLNILAILKTAAGGDLNNVKQAVQLIGFFNAPNNYEKHAALLNPASDALVKIMGEKGIHSRASVGATSLPLNSCVEINAIFELN